jgi:cysteine-rich repeat protein
MRRRKKLSPFRAIIVGVVVCLALPLPAHAATISVINLDGPNEGFNKATPAAPVGGNDGTTIGAQRLKAFQFAANIWGSRLNSAVEIRVGAEFNPLPCETSTAILGSAGPNSIIRDFANAPVTGTWFVQALANSFLEKDADPGEDDIGAEFNSSIGAKNCLSGSGWYLGLDGNPPPGQIDFVTIALHELGHGLGFLELVDIKTGEKLFGFDDAFMRFLEDRSTGKLYPDMTDQERVAASTKTGDLQWTGEKVTLAGEALVRGKDERTDEVEIYAPELQDPGASVSHFSDELSPNELMAPFYLGPNHNVELTVALFADMGWQVRKAEACGNGVLDLGEACDDGNRSSGDGCDQTCRVEACFHCDGEPSSCVLEPSCGLSLDHFSCYQAQIAKGARLFASQSLSLTDELGSVEAKLVKPTNLCTPAQVENGELFDPTAHLTCYQTKDVPGAPNFAKQNLRVANQFGGDQRITALGLQSFCVPSMADHTPSPLKIDPYACYRARVTQGAPARMAQKLELVDQFESNSMTLGEPVNFCAPVSINGEELVAPTAYLTCYQFQKTQGVESSGSHTVGVVNALGSTQALAVEGRDVLCVPSLKIAP